MDDIIPETIDIGSTWQGRTVIVPCIYLAEDIAESTFRFVQVGALKLSLRVKRGPNTSVFSQHFTHKIRSLGLDGVLMDKGKYGYKRIGLYGKEIWRRKWKQRASNAVERR